MIPPDLTDVSQESPREACANLAQKFQALAAESFQVVGQHSPAGKLWFVTQSDFASWASRLERACQRMDAEKSTVGPDSPLWKQAVDAIAREGEFRRALARMVSAHSIERGNEPHFCRCGACDEARRVLGHPQ